MKFGFYLFFFLLPFFSLGQNASVLLWKSLGDTALPFRALDIVLTAKRKIKPTNDSIISIIDFTKPSTEKRFFVIDIKNQKILIKTFVAHGKNTGENFALNFSNRPKSAQSSPGLYLTAETYYGKHGYSLKLKGLEKGINDNAYSRAIVIHGAWYVSEDFIKKYGRLGRSWGCPAVPENISAQIIDLIKDGSLLYIYTNDGNYWKKTQYK